MELQSITLVAFVPASDSKIAKGTCVHVEIPYIEPIIQASS